MSKTFIMVNGVPSRRDDDGLTLPIMAGGQVDPDDPYGDIFGDDGEGGGGPEPWGMPGGGGTIVGQQLFGLDEQYIGILKYVSGPTGGGMGPSMPGPATSYELYIQRPDGSHVKYVPGTYLVKAGGGEAYQLLADEGGKILKSSSYKLDGGGAPAYSGTQAAQAAQHAHDQAMARLNAQLAAAQATQDDNLYRDTQLAILAEQQRFADEQREASEKFQAEQNRLAEEAMLKRERLGVLQNLVEGFLQSQQRASEFVLSMQPDPFRFAAAAQGMPVMGTTPQEGYAEALTEFAGRPAPSMDPNAPLSAIEGGIESIMGQRFPLQPDRFGRGFAGGGTVPMGASGTFLVGERGPEVMDVSPTGVTVKPLQGGFAYGGGVDFDVSSIYAGLAPLYASLGFENIPTIRRGLRGDIYFGPTEAGFESGKDFLTALGIRPNLVRDPTTDAVYYREGETLRHIRSGREFEEMGFNWRDVINVSPRTIEEYGWNVGRPLREAPEFAPRRVGAMGDMPFATIEPMTRAVLPAPYKVAAERRRLASVNPSLYELGTSAYGFRGGIPATALRTAEDIFTPRGSYRTPIGLR